jgi:hypothetical protein
VKWVFTSFFKLHLSKIIVVVGYIFLTFDLAQVEMDFRLVMLIKVVVARQVSCFVNASTFISFEASQVEPEGNAAWFEKS